MSTVNHSLGAILRVGSFSYAPYHVFQRGGIDARLDGVCAEILKAVCLSLHLSYDLIPAADPYWGLRKKDGNWTGITGMIQRDEVDLSMAVLNPSHESEIVAETAPIFLSIELVILAGRISRHNGSLLDTVGIFSWQVWAWFFAALLVSALVIASAENSQRVWTRVTRGRASWAHEFNEAFWDLISNTFCESSPFVLTSGPSKLVKGAFWLLVIVMTTSFAGQMKASMMVKKDTDRVDSIEDIAHRPTLKAYIPQGSAVESSLEDSRDPSYRRVWEQVRRHGSVQPVQRLLNPALIDKTMRSEAVIILSRASHALRGERACSRNDSRGELYVGRTPCDSYNSAFFLNRHLPPRLRRDIRDRIVRLLEGGLIQKWWRESNGQWQGCGEAVSGDTLAFEDFRGIFMLLGGGFAVAAGLLLLEFTAFFVQKGSLSVRKAPPSTPQP